MNLAASRSAVPRLEWRTEAPSTNSELVAAASGPEAGSWPDLSVLATDNQTSGRGRLDRRWVAPAGRSLAISILLRPAEATDAPLPFEAYGWISLIAGVAMTRALRPFVENTAENPGAAPRTSVKWPNDVLIEGAKVSGILSELVPGTPDVVVGAGVNLFLTVDELPVATATSLQLAGATDFTADTVLAAYLLAFTELYRAFVRHGGDAVASGVARAVTDACGTLGQPVRVELPGDTVVTGVATGLDELGRLIVATDGGGKTLVVSAGDVTHLRY
ncbi:biotin--[acetyl-CoA-carboxylase] ligase [soil metagenome]